MRWVAGLSGAAVTAYLASQTLPVPLFRDEFEAYLKPGNRVA